MGASTANCASEAFVTESVAAVPATTLVAGTTPITGVPSGAYLINNGGLLGSATISPDIGEVRWWPQSQGHIPSNSVVADGSSKNRTGAFAALFAQLVYSSTVTFTNGSAVIAWAGNSLSVGDKIKFFTSGSLPTNFTAGTHGYAVGTEYCVVAAGLSTSQFEVASTCGGSAITAGSAGSGTQTAVNAPWGDGDGSTTFTLPKLIGDFIRGFDDGAGIDTNRQFGAEQLDAFQGHFHSVSQNAAEKAGVIAGSDWTNGTGSTVTLPPATITIGSPITDGVNGTPRTAAETRPRNMTLLPIIRYQ